MPTISLIVKRLFFLPVLAHFTSTRLRRSGKGGKSSTARSTGIMADIEIVDCISRITGIMAQDEIVDCI